jgi:putative ABC transporter, permease protein
MKQFLSLVIKEAKHIVRDKRTMLMLFGMPIVLMLLFGFAITNDVKNVRTVIVTSQTNYATQQAVDRLSASAYFTVTRAVATPAEARRLIQDQKADLAVVFSAHFSILRPDYQLIVDGTDPNMAQQWSTYAGAVLTNPSGGAVNTKLLYNPQMKSAYNFVPAIMGMLLMLICAMMTSISIVREKEKGTMEVLLVSPTPPLVIIAAKVVPYLILAFLILISILLMSAFVLHVPVRGSLFWIFAVSTLYILLALSLGLLVSNVAQTQLVALLLSAMVLIMPIIMLSGMLFPVESMPRILQYISATIPTRYYISAMRKLMIMGVGAKQVLNEMLVLLGMFVALLTLSLAKFNTRLA